MKLKPNQLILTSHAKQRLEERFGIAEVPNSSKLEYFINGGSKIDIIRQRFKDVFIYYIIDKVKKYDSRPVVITVWNKFIAWSNIGCNIDML